MKKIFAILLSLALVVSLGVLTAAPAIAADKPTDATPSISPVRAEFDLCDPGDVTLTVTEWGCAKNVTLVGLTIGVDYAVVGDTITIFEDWLAAQSDLDEINEQLCLVVHFEGPCLSGGVYETEFCIHAVGHLPTLSPVSAKFNLCNPADVTTTIDWCAATDITNVQWGATSLTRGDAWIVDGDELVILKSWLEDPAGANLTAINDQIVLYVTFDYASYTKPFVITAGCNCPAVSPEFLTFDLTYCTQDPAVMTTKIDWGAATEIEVIELYVAAVSTLTYVTDLVEGYHYAVDGDTLIILKDFFDYFVGTLGFPWLDLEIHFDAESCHPVNLTIMGVGDNPSFLLSETTYDICNPVLPTKGTGMIINWGKATTVTGFKEATLNGDALSSIKPVAWGGLNAWDVLNGSLGTTWMILRSYYYEALGMHTDLIYILGWFLNELLVEPGDTLWLVVEFDYINSMTGKPVTAELTITATGITAGIKPTEAEYNLDYALNCTPCADTNAQNVTTIVTWGCGDDVKYIEKIVDRAYDAPIPTLTYGAYGVGDYYIDPASENDTTGKLFIWDTYLDQVITYVGDQVVLNIVFGSGDEVDCVKPHEAAFTITGVGTGCIIYPTTAEFNLSDPKSVSTFLTKNWCCDNVTAVYHGSTPLTYGTDYSLLHDYFSVTLGKTVTLLTIAKDWLEDEDGGDLEDAGDMIYLSVIFGPTYGKATLTIVAVEDEEAAAMCFIATAAYGTPAAEEINILREFRDEVLLPSSLGAELVSLYYETSPPIAEFISQSEALRAAVRAGLDPIVAILNWSHGLWS